MNRRDAISRLYLPGARRGICVSGIRSRRSAWIQLRVSFRRIDRSRLPPHPQGVGDGLGNRELCLWRGGGPPIKNCVRAPAASRVGGGDGEIDFPSIPRRVLRARHDRTPLVSRTCSGCLRPGESAIPGGCLRPEQLPGITDIIGKAILFLVRGQVATRSPAELASA